jgi:hypothetical protein
MKTIIVSSNKLLLSNGKIVISILESLDLKTITEMIDYIVDNNFDYSSYTIFANHKSRGVVFHMKNKDNVELTFTDNVATIEIK